MLAKHYRPAPYDDGPSWLTVLRHTRDSLCSIALFQRKSILPTIHSILLAIGQFTRRLIGCGISSCHFDQLVVCSLSDAGIPVVDDSKSLSPCHDPPSNHHRCRRKLLGIRRTRRVVIFPRSPPFAERRIGTIRRKHQDARSYYGVTVLETEHEALNNYYHLFLMPSPLVENRSPRTNMETALDHAEARKPARKRHCREELRTLIAA